MNRYISIFLFSLLGIPLYAQEDSFSYRENSLFTDGVNMPASPQAWAMNRYGNESINLYNGTVGASIPIYDYKDNDFSIPVSINYSSDGYRPNIQNGPLGLGWNLSLGGAITREVRGIPDDTNASSEIYQFRDKYTGYHWFTSPYGQSPELYGYAYYCRDYDIELYDYSDDLVYSGKIGEEYMFVKEKWERTNGASTIPTVVCYEIMPDIFHFSGPGIEGRFVLQPGGQAIFYDTEDSPYGYAVDFELNGAGFLSFEITTSDKYVYTYSQVDMCNSTSQIAGANDDITTPGSWRLTRIEAPNGRYVSFIYNETNVSQSSQHVKCTEWSEHIPVDPDPDESGNDTASSSGGDGITWSRTHSDCLTQVKVCNANGTAVCTMDMNYISGVLECGAMTAACKKLSQITVKNINNRTIKHCTLDYDIIRDSVWTSSGVTLLKSVSIDGIGTTSFSYYGNNAGAINASTRFPAMTTLSVDWYGFYNPTVTSATFAPSMQTAQDSSSDTWLLTLRQPHLDGTRLGMLRSITYPTGGSATYEYELNTYSSDLTGLDTLSTGTTSGLRVKSVTLRDSDGSQIQKRSFLYTNGYISSGKLLRRPSIYIYYKIESSGFTRIERRSISTTSDLFYGITPHLEYTSVTERITKDGSSDVCEIDYLFSTCVDGVNGNSYGYSYREYYSQMPIFRCSHLDNDLRNDYLFNSIRAVQDYAGGGKLLSREEYTVVSGNRRPVKSDGFIYVPIRNNYPVDLVSQTFCLSLYTAYTYRFTTPRLTAHAVTEYALDGTVLKNDSRTFIYDTIQRPLRLNSTDSEGNTLSTRYFWDNGNKWLLNEKHCYRGELMTSGVKYTWQTPAESDYPNWFVPSTISRAAITLAHYEDEGSDPWDETSSSWYQVAAFSDFNAAGNPGKVTDALNHEIRYTWDSSLINPATMTVYPGGNSGPALTTTWNWIPLVGVSSVTTPGGKTARYSYDSYGRLTGIADTANNTLKQYYYYITNSQNDYSWTESKTFRTATSHADDITYYNGLGYPVLDRKVDPGNGYDSGTIISYDALMREDRKWLPAAFEDLDFTESEWAEFFLPAEYYVLTYYQDLYGSEPEPEEDPVPVRPFTETVSEFSPSGRPLSVSLPGEQYYLHPTTYDYLAAVIDGRNVTGVKMTDGDGRVSIEWKDYEDRVVALDRHTEDTTARTLFRYDWRGNLTEVVTPNGSRYLYTYDTHSRMTSRTIPGKAVETFAYDALDRVISSQDGNQRANGVTIRYYYDNVGNLTSKKAEKNNVLRTLEEYTYSTATGLKTSEKFYKLTADGWVEQYGYISRAYTYDNEERVTGVVETDDSETYSLMTAYTYDLQGNVTQTVETSSLESGSTIAVTTERQYDSRSRPTSETVKIGNTAKSTLSFYYDELGRPDLKFYGTGADRIYEYLAYTIQGWLSYRGGNLLTQSYGYESSLNPSWTGNITRWNWHHVPTAAENTTYPSLSETFTYDALNRLSGSAMTLNGQSAGNCWSERNTSYDLDGNILHLDRYQDISATPSTTLNFSYSGNRRNGYGYDSNGNITYDPTRNFEIRYNLLNLASEVRIPEVEGDNPQDPIDLSETVYYADGTRAGVADPDTGYWISRYIGSLIYSGENGEESLEGIQTADGFIEWNGSASNAQMQYFLRDHLGSVRVIATDKNNVLSRTDYLPFGVRMTGNGLPESASERSAWFGFSGKENELWDGANAMLSDPIPHWSRGERYQHFGARAYDPLTCIFMQIDPLCEKYYSLSPDAYCAGNPVKYGDKEGSHIRVADDYKKQFVGDLQKVFGKSTDLFSFDNNGLLRLDVKGKVFTKGMTNDQIAAFKGLNKAMNDKKTTSIIYADQYQITIGGELKQVDIVQEYGGGLYSKADNTIIISPNVGSIDVTLDQPQIDGNGLHFPTQTTEQNTTSTLFHEIGERNTNDVHFRGGVIDYENCVRRVIGLPLRPYDLNHSKTIKTDFAH